MKLGESMGGRIKIILAVAILLVIGVEVGYASDSRDVDNYKWRVDGSWWFSHPSGTFGVSGSDNYLNLNQDFGFDSYSTFTGKIDYRFRRKHHLLFSFSPVNNSRTVIINRTIEFQGQTYDVGSQLSASLKSLNFSPGYQYDIVRTNHGFLGLEVDFNLLDTEATLSGSGSVNGQVAARSSSKSFLAPLPTLGPTGRWYPLHNSNRLSLEGSARGMYFFGYGDFVTARGSIGVGLTNRLVLRAGYEMGSRLSIHGTADQIAVRNTQKGPTAGIEYSWGEFPEQESHASSSTQPSDWHVEWIPLYLWFSGLQGNVGARGFVAPVNVGFSEIFDQLNIGLMSVMDVRRKRIGLLTDLVFISLSSDQKATPVGGVFSGFTANAKTFFVDPEVYFRVLDRDRGSVDLVGGARFWRLDNSLVLLQGSAQAATAGQTQSWVDPVLGARFRLNLKKGFFATLKGDAGGFGVGSQQTWQVYTGIGKEFKQKFSLQAGYRYLDVDYTNGGFLYDTHMSGLIAGFGLRLK
jgi:hypothetical protein